jgi:hypothetical protein
MLKITKATDPIEVKTISLNLYSPPGIGKTSMGYTADKPLLIDFDKGSHRSKNRRDSVQVETWDDVLAITAEDLVPYHTVVVDTAGRALDVLTPWIIKANAKHGRGGALTLQGYGELKTQFGSWLKFIRSFGLDVVLLSHSDEAKSGDEMVERLDIQGGSKNEVYKSADVMGRIYLNGNKRWLNFSPTDTTFGKNPAGLPPIEVPSFKDAPDFLAGVITTIKANLNEMSAEQTEVAGLLADWKAKVDAAVVAADFNALLPLGKGLDERIRDNAKRIMAKAARDREINFAAGAFIDKPAAVVTPPADAAAPAVDGSNPPAEAAATDGAAPLDPSPSAPAAASPAAEGSAPTATATDADEEANRKAAEPTAEEMRAAVVAAQAEQQAKPANGNGTTKKAKAKKAAEPEAAPAELPPVDANEAGSNG